ncbi:hypothetical protein [Lacinutrix sp. MEBiC02404]
MKNLITITLLSIFLLSFSSFAQNEITSTKIFTSKKCTYSVYKVKSGGTYRCKDYIFVGVVTPNNDVSISVKKGQNYTIFVKHGNRNPCGKNKLSTSISVGPLQYGPNTIREELYDNMCN